MIVCEYHPDLKEVQSDDALRHLLGAAVQQAPFDRLEWWQGLVEQCGLAPLLSIARDGEGRFAVLPLRRKGRELHALSNWYSFRFRPILSAPANAPQQLRALAKDLRRHTTRISLEGVPNEDGSADLLQAAFAQAGWLVLRNTCDINHFTHVSGRSWEEFLADRPGPLRTTIKRKSGKVQATVLTRFDDPAWDAYEAIYAESWKPREGSPAFLSAFARQEGAKGRLRLGLAHTDGRVIAAQMWTVEGGTAYIHKLAHREDATRLSPGSVLSAALFRHVIDVDGVHTIDFGTGDDGYKRDWMDEARPRFRLDMFRIGDPRNWPVLARRIPGYLAARLQRG